MQLSFFVGWFYTVAGRRTACFDAEVSKTDAENSILVLKGGYIFHFFDPLLEEK